MRISRCLRNNRSIPVTVIVWPPWTIATTYKADKFLERIVRWRTATRLGICFLRNPDGLPLCNRFTEVETGAWQGLFGAFVYAPLNPLKRKGFGGIIKSVTIALADRPFNERTCVRPVRWSKRRRRDAATAAGRKRLQYSDRLHQCFYKITEESLKPIHSLLPAKAALIRRARIQPADLVVRLLILVDLTVR